MSSTKKSLRLGIPLLLSFALASGSRASAQPVPEPNEVVVHVSLVDGKPKPDIDPVKLSKGKKNFAHWVLDGDGDLEIKMKKGNPFKGAFGKPGKEHVRSTETHPNAKEGKYPYSITVTPPGGQPVTTDPDIEVDR